MQCNSLFYFQNNQLNPVWNEHFQFIVEDASTQHLTVRIFDDEGIQAPELIGCAKVPLKDLKPGKVEDLWLNLVKDFEVQRDTKYRGQVRMLYESYFSSIPSDRYICVGHASCPYQNEEMMRKSAL
jgi:Ca2+-dependent lipid-binding protein